MHSRTIAIAAALLGLVSGPARACEWDPFLFQLPGESEAEAHERSDKIHSDFTVVGHERRERYAFEKAADIFLARVVSSAAGNFKPGEKGPSSSVRPITSLKGSLPPEDQSLFYGVQPGACTDYGDGQGAISPVGTLVVVFDGLPITKERPRGIDSFHVSAIRTIPLLDLLREYGKDLED